MRLTPENMLKDARSRNPTLRYALRKEPAAGGGAVLGAFDHRAGGFIPVSVETGKDTGVWEPFPPAYLEIDGNAVAVDPNNWTE